MNKQDMLVSLNNQLPEAIKEAQENHFIDGIFTYGISDTVQVSNPSSDDVLISITLYTPYADEVVSLVLSGIDEHGVVDIIKVSPADENGLDSLITLMDEIENNGIYNDAETWSAYC